MSYVSKSVSSLVVGDYIGMESCIDLAPSCSGVDGLLELSGREAEARPPLPLTRVEKCRSFPPPIPSLAQTENQQPHMPWVMRRYYSGDGRLVIREERVRHHDYFTAHRSNGRLTLRLVPLDDDDGCCDCDSASASASGSSGEEEHCGNLDGDDRTRGGDSPDAERQAATDTTSASVEFGTGTGKCSEYDGMGSSACNFRMPPVMVLGPVLG